MLDQDLFEPALTVPELAKRASTCPNTIYGLIYSGKLRAIQLNPENETRKNWRVPLSSWKEFIGSK